MSEDKAPTTEFRIGLKSKPKEIITQCEKLLKDEKVKDLHLSGVGTSIGELISIVAVLKSIYPKLYTKSLFSVIPGRTTDKNKDKKEDKKEEPKNQKLYPRLEITVSNEKIVDKDENSVKLSEEEKTTLIDTLGKNKELFIKRRRLRRPFRRNRRWGYNNIRRQRFAYSAKRAGYNNRRFGFTNSRRPYGKPPVKRNNLRKYNGNKTNAGRKPVSAKN